MYRIQSIKVARSALTFATILAFLYAVIFLIVMSSLFVCGKAGGMRLHRPMHLPAEVVSVLVVPPLVFVTVWIFFYPLFALFCFLYNQVTKVTGGIEFSIF
jgi:hypothetical protein